MDVSGKGAMRPLGSSILLCAALIGCVGGDKPAVETTRAAAPPPALEQQETSEVIDVLLGRQSVIPANSSYDVVARAVLASNARTAEAELRAARLRASAANKNWLPKIGPVISLTSLGDVVASLILEQVLFDNGRRKAERRFAAADVEVAAVGLSESTNDRVYTALSLYLAAERARAERAVARNAHSRMAKFVNIIERRVNGGVSNMADLRVAQSKMQELSAEGARAQEATSAALGELGAMADLPLADLTGLTALDAEIDGMFPLAVLRAQAEGQRGVAQAKIDRAGLLPGVKAQGSLTERGLDGGLAIDTNGLIGFGIGDSLAALKMSEEAARRGVDQATEDSERVLRRLLERRASLKRQQGEANALVVEARNTFSLFYNQFENSGRPIMDVVNIYENTLRLEREQVRLRYELATISVEIAKLYGVLVDGEDV